MNDVPPASFIHNKEDCTGIFIEDTELHEITKAKSPLRVSYSNKVRNVMKLPLHVPNKEMCRTDLRIWNPGTTFRKYELNGGLYQRILSNSLLKT